MEKFKGIARCSVVQHPQVGPLPDLPKGCTWKRSPAGYKYPTPSASNPEYLVEFTTVGDRFAELEAYAGVLYVYEYGGC